MMKDILIYTSRRRVNLEGINGRPAFTSPFMLQNRGELADDDDEETIMEILINYQVGQWPQLIPADESLRWNGLMKAITTATIELTFATFPTAWTDRLEEPAPEMIYLRMFDAHTFLFST